MNNGRTRGIILDVSDHGESDKIIVFYSPDMGRAAGIAKGAKRSKKRFVNKLELFSHLELEYRTGRQGSLLLIQEAELAESFLSLRQHYARYLTAMYIGELTLRFTREHDPDPVIFDLILWGLHGLDKGHDPLETATFFHLRLLGAAGYEPLLDCCGACGTQAGAGNGYTLHADSGSVLCGSCRDKLQGSVLSLSLQTLRFLHHAQRTEIANLSRLRLARHNCVEALTLLYRYTQHLLQRDIHAWKQFSSLDPDLSGSHPPPLGTGDYQNSLPFGR